MKIITMSALCLATVALAGCFNKEKIVDLGDAENQVITDSGRHFVTGHAIYEITKEDGEYTATRFGPDCAYAGVVQYKDYLITNCMEAKLINARKRVLYGKLVDGQLPELNELANVAELSIPNGLAVKGEGELLIGNSNYFGPGSIARLTFVESDGQLIGTGLDKDYLSGAQGVYGANGVRMLGNTLYFTDFNASNWQTSVGKVTFDADGKPGEVEELISQTGVFDDLWPYCGGVLVTDFFGGRMIYQNQHGEIFKSNAEEFIGLSSIYPASGALYNDGELLLTEKGILLDSRSKIGNQLSRIKISGQLLKHIGADCQK